jgi:hypothetical protein
MQPSPRPTISELSDRLRKAKKAKQKTQADRLAKLLWLRKRQEARQALRKAGV